MGLHAKIKVNSQTVLLEELGQTDKHLHKQMLPNVLSIFFAKLLKIKCIFMKATLFYY